MSSMQRGAGRAEGRGGRVAQVGVAAVLILVWGVAAGTAEAAPKPVTSWVPASHANYTPSTLGRGIQYVVIHDTEGSGVGAISWFQNPAAHVSAHYVILGNGHITQMVADKDTAWHSGNSSYNAHSIGIEHAGFAATGGFTEVEYAKSAALVAWICDHYGIPKDRHHIIGHNEVPDPDGTGFGGANHHTDPGPHWNWTHFMSLVHGHGGGGSPAPGPSLKALKVNTVGLNVRSGAGYGHSILGFVFEGQVYVSHGADGPWRKIWYKGNSGWVQAYYLSQVHATARKVTAPHVDVRTGPAAAAAAVGAAHDGELYVRTDASGDWQHIFYGGAKRWLKEAHTTGVGL